MAMATKAPLSAGQGGLVGGGDDDDGFAAAGLVQIFFEEFAHFAAAFADEGDDVDVGLGLAGDHAQQGGFADAAAGEDAEALAAAAGNKSVDGLDAGLEGLADALALEGMGRLEIQADVVGGLDGALFVEGVAQAVQHAALQCVRRRGRARRSRGR